ARLLGALLGGHLAQDEQAPEELAPVVVHGSAVALEAASGCSELVAIQGLQPGVGDERLDASPVARRVAGELGAGERPLDDRLSGGIAALLVPAVHHRVGEKHLAGPVDEADGGGHALDHGPDYA